jgi:hypothetical protein
LWSGGTNDRNRRIQMSEQILDSAEMNGAMQRPDEGQKFDMKMMDKQKVQERKWRETRYAKCANGTSFWILSLNIY